MDPPRAPDRPIADTVRRSWVNRAPAPIRPYLRLARADRPAGFWLLSIPCWAGLVLARADGSWRWSDLGLAGLLTLGAFVMRAAGCVYNDIVDKDLDAQVARTADRPLAAGTVSLFGAWALLGALLLAALAVLLAIPTPAQITALGAIPIIAAYPFMKRITWFPQAWLGVAMNWGALVAAAAVRDGPPIAPDWILFAGLWAWTFGYDTIYAHQDKDDDALIGVKSTARLFAAASRKAVALSYGAAAVLCGFAAAVATPGAGIGPVIITGAFGLGLALQITWLNFDDPDACLRAFKANQPAGIALVIALFSAGV